MQIRQSLRKPTVSLAAYDFLLRGIVHFRGYGAEDNSRACAFFEKALACDPSYALAQSYLALARIALHGYGAAPEDVKRASSVTARRGVDLDPQEGGCVSQPRFHLAAAWRICGRLRRSARQASANSSGYPEIAVYMIARRILNHLIQGHVSAAIADYGSTSQVRRSGIRSPHFARGTLPGRRQAPTDTFRGAIASRHCFDGCCAMRRKAMTASQVGNPFHAALKIASPSSAPISCRRGSRHGRPRKSRARRERRRSRVGRIGIDFADDDVVAVARRAAKQILVQPAGMAATARAMQRRSGRRRRSADSGLEPEEIGTVVVGRLVEGEQEGFEVVRCGARRRPANQCRQPLAARARRVRRHARCSSARTAGSMSPAIGEIMASAAIGVVSSSVVGRDRLIARSMVTVATETLGQIGSGFTPCCPAAPSAAASSGCAWRAIRAPVRWASGRRSNSPAPGRSRSTSAK